MEYYKFIKVIGKGSFGKVVLAVHKLTSKLVAIKTFEKSELRDEYRKRRVF
jgi:serine/threonine protein kinase